MKKGRVLFVFLIFLACDTKQEVKESSSPLEGKDSSEVPKVEEVFVEDTTQLERSIRNAGCIWMGEVDASILVDLKYSDTANFLHEDVYGDFHRLYLHPVCAEKLKKAQALLKEHDSTLTLLVYDGVRPRSVQQKMWDIIDLPPSEKGKFVSNPKNGSLHNYGLAVDITIASPDGKALDMGTPYDDPSEQSYPSMEAYFLEQGQLNSAQIANRRLLRQVMYKAGFFGIQTEWWHFNASTRAFARENYTLVE
jgi:D-alanyl-D-alanine dipeptidase